MTTTEIRERLAAYIHNNLFPLPEPYLLYDYANERARGEAREEAARILEILQIWQPVAEADYHHPDGLTMLHVEDDYLAISCRDGNGTWHRNTIQLPAAWSLCERKP